MSLTVNTMRGSDAESHKVRVELVGSLDTATANECQQSLAPFVEDPAVTTMIFDLAGLEFLSSAGIRVLLAARKKITKRKGRLLMVNLQPQIEKVFVVIKALPNMSVFSNMQELDDYLAGIQAKVREKQSGS